MIKFYVDGSARGNPGKGGFGVVIIYQDSIIYAYGKQSDEITTNNKEELKALIHAFEIAQERFANEDCIIYSDSAYVVNICNNWIRTWAKNNWLNSKKQPVENLDLIQRIYKYITKAFFNCRVEKVDGHNGIIGNELADALATDNAFKFAQIAQKEQMIVYDYHTEI